MNNLPPFFQYERGSMVNFLGNEKYKPFKATHIWAILREEGYSVAYIQHDDGLLKSEFKASVPFNSETELIPDSHFDPKIKYIEVIEQEIVFSDEIKREGRNNVIRKMITELYNRLSK